MAPPALCFPPELQCRNTTRPAPRAQTLTLSKDFSTKSRERPHPVNIWFRVEAATLVNTLFKKKKKQAQEDEMAPPAPMDHTSIIYPSGLKLALLMMSIFVGMFLVSLVR